MFGTGISQLFVMFGTGTSQLFVMFGIGTSQLFVIFGTNTLIHRKGKTSSFGPIKLV
jgi:hypothetical protein